MAPIGEHGSGDPPIGRARAALDRGVRGMKTWWRSLDEPEHPGASIERAPDVPGPSHAGGTADGVVDELRTHVVEELERLRHEVGARDAELLHALQRLGESFDRIVDRLESDAQERRMLSEAVLRLERRLPPAEGPGGPAGELPSGERVLGGRVSPPSPRLQPELPPPEISFASIKSVRLRESQS